MWVEVSPATRRRKLPINLLIGEGARGEVSFKYLKKSKNKTQIN